MPDWNANRRQGPPPLRDDLPERVRLGRDDLCRRPDTKGQEAARACRRSFDAPGRIIPQTGKTSNWGSMGRMSLVELYQLMISKEY